MNPFLQEQVDEEAVIGNLSLGNRSEGFGNSGN